MPKLTRSWMGAIALSICFFALVAVWSLNSLSQEVEERFRQSVDSVPTKVYSSVYWLKPGVGASLEEIRYRFREREYREVSRAELVEAPGTFHIETDSNKKISLLVFSPIQVSYPQAVRDILFGATAIEPFPAKVTVRWQGSTIEAVEAGQTQPISGFALEPVVIAQLNEGSSQARRTIPLAHMPHTLMKGIVLTEDQRFLEHAGIDPRGILRSMYVNLKSGGYVQGASTITQQLARNIYLNRQKTISRKLKEMLVSVLLEIKFSKDEILEKYLNEVYFGQSGSVAIHGVSEAAKFYFGKNLEDLSIAEQALLAGIVRGPFYYSPFRHLDRAKSRQEIVLTKMFDAGVITKQQFESAKNESLVFVKASLVQNRAPYFTDLVQAQLLKDMPEQEVIGAGYSIFSTLDTYYQSIAERSVSNGVAKVEERLRDLKERKKVKIRSVEPIDSSKDATRLAQGVFIGVDPVSGAIRALVGGRSYEESTFNRVILMKRHIGSLVKPFVYLVALINGRDKDGSPLNSISKFEDKPFTYEFDGKSWTPRNYEEEFMGTVTLRYALANSINTVAAQLAVETGLPKLVEALKASGLSGDIQPLPSLSLGAVEIAPLDIATSYTTLANFGLRKELTGVLAVLSDDDRIVARFQPREEQVFPKPETANLVQLMTTTFESGTAKPARSQGFFWPAAGKTGTTNEFRDAWFAGFTKKMIGISWVGFDRDDEIVRHNRKKLKLTGAAAALPIWTDFMLAAHKDQEMQPLDFPADALRSVEVDLITGKRANHRCRGDSVVDEFFTSKNIPLGECE